MSGAVAGRPARFRAVIGADQQSFALRRLPGLWATVLIVPGRSQDLLSGILQLMCGLLLSWLAVLLHFRRPVVSVTSSELRARGLLGVTHKVKRSEIAGIDLRARTYGRQVTRVRVPYVRKAGGGGFWLDALPVSPGLTPVARPPWPFPFMKSFLRSDVQKSSRPEKSSR